MSQEWRTVSLSDVCRIEGVLVDPRHGEYQHLPHVGGGNIVSETGELTDILTAEEEGLISGKYTFDADTVLYSKIRPYLRKVARPDFAGLCSADMYPLLPDQTRLNRDFLYWLLLSPNFTDYAVAGSARAGMPKVNRSHLFNFRFPLPPLAEQERIVRILDEALDAIETAQANTQQNIANTDALFLTHLKNLFTNPGPDWQFKTVDQLADRCLGKMLDKAKNRGEPKPYLRNLNVRWFDFDLSDLSSMKFLDSEADRYRVQDGDVVVCEGGYPGRAAVWSGSPIYFQKALHRVRFAEPALSWWFVYYLYFTDATGTLRDHFTGTGISHFTGKALGRFPLPVPELNGLRDTLEGIHELRSQCTQLARQQANQLQALDRLRRSVLQDAFETGLRSTSSRAFERQSE